MAHKRLVTGTRILSSPARYVSSPVRLVRSAPSVRVVSSPIRVLNVRSQRLPSSVLLNREYSKVRSHPHYYATENYLNSSSVKVNTQHIHIRVNKKNTKTYNKKNTNSRTLWVRRQSALHTRNGARRRAMVAEFNANAHTCVCVCVLVPRASLALRTRAHFFWQRDVFALRTQEQTEKTNRENPSHPERNRTCLLLICTGFR